MKDKTFFDSNLLAYYATDAEKRKKLQSLFLQSYEVYISTQCLNEFSNVCIKKRLLEIENIKLSVQNFALIFDIFKPNEATLCKALDIHLLYQYSFYDSLILASALECGCEVLYSEDLNHGQTLEGLQIINPFLNL